MSETEQQRKRMIGNKDKVGVIETDIKMKERERKEIIRMKEREKGIE